MIKKYMNELYKEIEQIRRKLISGKMRYFADKEFGNALSYVVILKNGSYFYINIGANNIPKIKKKEIAFIYKRIAYSSDSDGWKNNWADYVDSDRGHVRFDMHDRTKENYLSAAYRKYKIIYDKEIDTGCWD